MPFPYRGADRLGGEELGSPGGSELRIHLPGRRRRRLGFDPGVGKIPWRSSWQPTPAFSPEESHGQRSLMGCGPQGHREADLTEVTEHARLQGTIYRKQTVQGSVTTVPDRGGPEVRYGNTKQRETERSREASQRRCHLII